MEKPDSRFSEEFRSALDEIVQSGWQTDPAAEKRLRTMLMPAVAWYLSREKNAGGKPEDPVARFHLGNGAQLERINWAADISDNGIASSFGVMVNYRYRLEQIEKNHELYVNSGTVSVSGAISRMAASFDNKLVPGAASGPEPEISEVAIEDAIPDDSAAA
jgi:malonyl-CoA decarboxylase